jgi:hypothetical protein
MVIFRLDKNLVCVKHGKTRHSLVGDTYLCLECVKNVPKQSLDHPYLPKQSLYHSPTSQIKTPTRNNKVSKGSNTLIQNTVHEPVIASDSKVEPFVHGQKYSILDLKYWQEFLKKRFKKKTTYLIFMYLRNGKLSQFTVSSSGTSFEYLGGLYQLNPDVGITDLHSNYMTLVYCQDISTPFRLKFDLDELRRGVETLPDATIKKALNPYALKEFINSSIIEMVIKGQELSKDLRMMKMLIIITLIITSIVALLVANMSGIF